MAIPGPPWCLLHCAVKQQAETRSQCLYLHACLYQGLHDSSSCNCLKSCCALVAPHCHILHRKQCWQVKRISDHVISVQISEASCTSRMASLKPLMMDVGCILFLTRSLALFKISAATMTTEVVPSPTSWSCSSASSTSICRGTSSVDQEQQYSLLLQLLRRHVE